VKVLVTGATGFLGRHLLDALREHAVRALVRRPVELGVETAIGDVNDPASLERAMDGVDAVIHAAGAVAHKPADAPLVQRVHVEGTTNVMRAAKGKRIVHLSSSGTIAVSATPKVLDESAPDPLTLVSRWPYYRAKRTSEPVALDAGAVVLNPSLLLGPGGRDGSNRIVQLFLDGWITASPPGGSSIVDVRDVAEQCARCLTTGTAGERYLLGAANWTFADILGRLARISGQKAPLFSMPRVTRQVLEAFPGLGKDEGIGFFGRRNDREDVELACHFWYLDDAKARRDIGWSPRDPMETLTDAVHDLRRRGAA
jgi:dihydroflavonol-4-reductase